MLEHLHVLSNYDFDSKPLLSLVLVGLPDLWDTLKARINASTAHSGRGGRIAIPEATPADTAEYMQHRIGHAKGPKDLFSSDAISVLHEGTLGHLRDLDRVATNAIKAAVRRKLTSIDRAVTVISEVFDADTGLLAQNDGHRGEVEKSCQLGSVTSFSHLHTRGRSTLMR